MAHPDQQILETLNGFKEFSDVPKNQLKWLVNNSTLNELQEGDFLFEPGDQIDKTHFILKGEIELYIFQNGNKRLFTTYTPGGIIGYLPYSRAQNAQGYGEAIHDSKVLSFPKSKIQDLINQCPELTEELVHIMISRVRDFTSQNLQNEKMLALGKLSAGLAHELNNPISAITRDASQLSKVFDKADLNRMVLICTGLPEEDIDHLMQKMEFWKNPENKPKLRALERSRLESRWEDQLNELEVADADLLSETFTEFGIQPEQLETWLGKVNPDQKALFMSWIHFSLETHSLLTNIHSASSRVNGLIGAVKSYTHMDRAPEKQELDLYESINDTLTILAHKVRKNKIEVQMEKPEPPLKICGYVGELNQVWTNLIDNALDAMEETKDAKLTIEFSEGKSSHCVFVIDNGSGIPEKDLPKIFDPFFTTKEIGKGSGMGLDLVNQIIQKHQGKITVDSKPGHTSFKVTLPTN